MKLDQIAYYAHNDEQVHRLKTLNGLLDAPWVEDRAVGGAWVMGLGWSANVAARLRFCYALGIEFEILTYETGHCHWHYDRPEWQRGEIFLSHVGYHMEPGQEVPTWVWDNCKLVQVMDTHTHTNPYVVERGRTYHYKIFRPEFGPDLKYIWRKEKLDD